MNEIALREKVLVALGKNPKPKGLWQQLLYVAAREYETDAKLDKQADIIMQLMRSNNALARIDELGRHFEGPLSPKNYVGIVITEAMYKKRVDELTKEV